MLGFLVKPLGFRIFTEYDAMKGNIDERDSKVSPSLEILKVDLSEEWVEVDKEIVKTTCPNPKLEVKISYTTLELKSTKK